MGEYRGAGPDERAADLTDAVVHRDVLGDNRIGLSPDPLLVQTALLGHLGHAAYSPGEVDRRRSGRDQVGA